MTSEAAPVLFWVRRPPFSTAHFAESVRVAAMATALEAPVRLLFIGEGVRAVARGAEPYRYGPPVEKLLAGIVTDARPALVHGPSLDRRGLGPEALAPQLPVERLDDEGAADWLVRSSRVVPF